MTVIEIKKKKEVQTDDSELCGFFFFSSKNTLGEYTIVEVEAVQLQTVLDVSGNGI